MDIQMYRAKVKTEGVENFERGTGMKLNLVMNGNKKENKNKEAEEGRKGGREEGRKGPVNLIGYCVWSGGLLGQMYQKCSHLIPKGTDYLPSNSLLSVFH